MIRETGFEQELRSSKQWLHADARRLLGALGDRAQVFNVYSAGDSGEGCEVIEFVTPSVCGPVAWTARIVVVGDQTCASCTLGWIS